MITFQQKQFKNNLVCLLISILPITRYYKIFTISIGHIILYILIFYSILHPRKKINSSNYLKYVFLYYVLINFSVNFLIRDRSPSYGVLIINLFIILYLFVDLGFSDTIEPERLIKFINIVSVFACILILFQYFSFYLLGRYFNFIFQNILIQSISENTKQYFLTGIASSYFRPTGAIFLEPAHFASYIGISAGYKAYSLFRKKENKDLVSLILFSISLIISSSSIGLLIVCSLWIFCFYNFLIYVQKRIYLISVIIIILLFIFFIISKSNVILVFENRFLNSGFIMNSVAVRGRMAGYISFSNNNLFERFFGVGLGYENDNKSYFTTLSVFLYRWGYVGIFIFLISILDLLKDRNKKIIIVQIIIIFISADTYDFCNISFYYIIINSLYSEREYKDRNAVMNKT